MLSVIGAGFGRTGTMSIKAALERLGFGPCYHMIELFEQPGHAPIWADAADERPVDWDALLDAYGSTIDWPASYFWQPLMEHYPSARVLLTVRDSGDWYDSMAKTILPNLLAPPSSDIFPTRDQHSMARKVVLEKTFCGRVENRDDAIAVFEAHNQRVIDTIPEDRLLVYRVTDGWAPLCDFLDCPVPDEEFPRKNTTAEFQAQFNGDDK